jgi:hypothetical protein
MCTLLHLQDTHAHPVNDKQAHRANDKQADIHTQGSTFVTCEKPR